MGCPCRTIRGVISRFPGGLQLVSMLPELREEVVQDSKPGLHSPADPEHDNTTPPVMGGVTPDAVLSEAQSWLKTPFHHGQRCKGAGVDCGQFLLGVYHNAGCIPNVKTPYYPQDFHLHRDVEWYKTLVEQFAREIPGPPEPADVVLYHIGRIFSHGAIVVAWPKIIHAFIESPFGVDYGDGLQGHLKKRLLGQHEYKFYRPLCFGVGEK